MSIVTAREQRRELERQNAKLPRDLQFVPNHEWPEQYRSGPKAPLRVWRSRDYFVQEYRAEAPALVRLSVNRTSLTGDRWNDNLAWEDLQDIKKQCGYPLADAVEVYPPCGDVVNVANMRHLWVLRERLAFAWRGSGA